MASVSSSSQQYKLILNILLEQFGPIIRDIGGYILRRGQCNLTDIRRFLDDEQKNVKLSQIKEALTILIQHNLLRPVVPTMEELQKIHPRVFLYYELDINAITLRLRFPKFVLRAKELFGEKGQVILEQILFHGRLNMSQIKKHAVSKLVARKQLEGGEGSRGRASSSSLDTSEVDPTELLQLQESIQATTENMIKSRYVVRVVPFDLSKPTILPTATSQRSSRMQNTATAAAAAKEMNGEPKKQPVSRKRKAKEIAVDDDGDAVPIELAMMIPSTAKKDIPPATTMNGNGAVKVKLEPGTDPNAASSTTKGGKAKASTTASKGAAKRGRGGAKGKAAGAEENGGGVDAEGPGEEWDDGGVKKAMNGGGAVVGASSTSIDEVSALTAGDDILWKIGADQFHRDLRHLACARFVKQKVNTTAENLVKAILKASLPIERDVATEKTQMVAVTDIAKQVQLPPNLTVKMYMDVLKNDQVKIVGSGGGNGDAYCVNMKHIIESLKQRTLHSIIKERYSKDDKANDGDRNARICRVLLDKKYLDQQQLSELAMMSLRETRERLYHMYRDEVVTFQEVPRRSDHHPNQTFYLWTFNKQVVRELTDRMYKGALNLRLRRQKETEENSDLLANKDNIRDEVEAAHFDKLTMALDRLDQALENLDETIMLFTVF